MMADETPHTSATASSIKHQVSSIIDQNIINNFNRTV